jgi:hypothetical protein
VVVRRPASRASLPPRAEARARAEVRGSAAPRGAPAVTHASSSPTDAQERSPSPRTRATPREPTTAWPPVGRAARRAPREFAAPAQPSAAHAEPASPAPSSLDATDAIGPARAAEGLVDGVAFVTRALDAIRAHAAHRPDARRVVVFDLDNTLFETRARTLVALQAYDAARGTRHFGELVLDDVAADGASTAERLGLAPQVQADVQAFWLEAFWRPRSFAHDHLLVDVAALVHEAHAAGAEVVYLTGRVERDATIAQLRAAGLPLARDEDLVTKPTVGASTALFKAEWLGALTARDDTFLAWFATEGRRDIAGVQAHEPEIPCLLVGYREERHTHALRAGTPYLPERYTAVSVPLDGRAANVLARNGAR